MERFGSGLLLTSSQVAELLGVHVSTVKRWSNDGELRSSTTAGGHRRIHLDDALEAARSRGISTYLDPFAPCQGHVWRAVREAEDSGDFRRFQSLAMGWLLREYPQRVGDLFVELGNRGRVPFEHFFERGIRDFVVRASEAVRDGRLHSGGERVVSQILLEALVRVRLGVPIPASPPQPNGAPRAIVGSLGGDAQGLRVMGLRLLLEREGFDVYYLGPDALPDEFAAAQRSRQADLICVVGESGTDRAPVLEAVRKLATSYDARAPFALVVSPAAGPLDLSGVPNPFVALTVPDSTEALAQWIRKRVSRDVAGRKASA